MPFYKGRGRGFAAPPTAEERGCPSGAASRRLRDVPPLLASLVATEAEPFFNYRVRTYKKGGRGFAAADHLLE